MFNIKIISNTTKLLLPPNNMHLMNYMLNDGTAARYAQRLNEVIDEKNL